MKLAAALIAAVLPVSASAATCLSTEEMVVYLISEFGELPLHAGSSRTGLISAMFVNPETGTWTIIHDNGVTSCIADFGTGWLPIGEGV